MAMQELGAQEQALNALKNQLENLKTNLIGQMDTYKRQVDSLHQDGLSREVYNTYLGYYEYDRSKINDLIHHIDSIDIPYIKKNIGKIGEAKEEAGKNLDLGF